MPGSVNKTLIELIFQEPLEDNVVLDVGCGAGALTFIVAQRAGKVIGIDISKVAIETAKKKSVDNTSFFVMDADSSDYTSLGKIDCVISHLCMSNEIIKGSHTALPKNGPFIFAGFHSDHLIEGGRRSRFSYTEEEMKNVLEETGFKIEYLGVETTEQLFQNKGEAIEILGEKTMERWEKDGRIKHFMNYVERGGRHLTKSILVGKARK
jgi:SAM-dependent methyltransferase